VTVRIAQAPAWGMALVVLLAGPAFAQSGPISFASSAAGLAQAGGREARSDIEVSVNLVNHVTNKGVGNTYTGGFRLNASYRVAHLISVIGDFTADYDKRDTFTANIYTYTGGARFGSGMVEQKFRPFAEVTLGSGQDNGDGTGKTNRFPVVTPGAGVDMRLTNRVALRTRLDFPLLMRYSDMLIGTRLSVGIALPLGRR
jgi:Outer membrane protein beta-barrel domain